MYDSKMVSRSSFDTSLFCWTTPRSFIAIVLLSCWSLSLNNHLLEWEDWKISMHKCPILTKHWRFSKVIVRYFWSRATILFGNCLRGLPTNTGHKYSCGGKLRSLGFCYIVICYCWAKLFTKLFYWQPKKFV